MTSPRRSIAALLTAGLLAAGLAGCGGGSAPTAARPLAATTTASPTPSPTPTPPTKAQAGKIYLAAVTPANKAFAKLNAALKAQSLKRIHATAKAAAKANRAFLVVLTDTQWPKNVQKNAEKVSETVAVDQSALTALTTAKTLADADDAANSMATDNSQAQLMRVKLGLGAIPAT